ncbi:MAG: 50S ribosomal protein L10 [Fimbriimonadaceae bacterium]|nr:50S ribosomal protein L10 [Fimbriimonadaceae bacterium]
MAELSERFGRAQSAVFVDYTGLSVFQMRTIRRALRAEGCDFQVAKNTLIRIALDATGRKLVDGAGAAHDSLTEGVTAVAFGYDNPAAAAKVLLDLKKDLDALKFKGGFFGDNPVSGDAGVQKIANMRTKEDALRDVVRILKGGPSRLRMLLGAAPQKIITLKTLLEQESEQDAA